MRKALNASAFFTNEIKSKRCRFKDIFHDWWTMNQKILIVSRFKHSWNEIVCLYFTLTSICRNSSEAIRSSKCMSNKCLWQYTCVFRLDSTHVIAPATWTDQTFTNDNDQSGDKNVESCYVKKNCHHGLTAYIESWFTSILSESNANIITLW